MIPKIDRFCSVSRAAIERDIDHAARADARAIPGNRPGIAPVGPLTIIFRTNQMPSNITASFEPHETVGVMVALSDTGLDLSDWHRGAASIDVI